MEKKQDSYSMLGNLFCYIPFLCWKLQPRVACLNKSWVIRHHTRRSTWCQWWSDNRKFTNNSAYQPHFSDKYKPNIFNPPEFYKLARRSHMAKNIGVHCCLVSFFCNFSVADNIGEKNTHCICTSFPILTRHSWWGCRRGWTQAQDKPGKQRQLNELQSEVQSGE